MTTVSSIIGKTSPKALDDKDFLKAINKFSSYTGLKTTTSMIDNIDDKYKYLYDIPTFLGIEVEVEGINYKAVLPKFWEGKMDGSLRGPQEERAEFCTLPLTPRQSLIATSFLWTMMKELGKPSFSWRTSVHDHLNVIDLKETEVKALMTLSALFEPLLFGYVGASRAQSVFCVPITESYSHQLLSNYIHGRVGLKKLAQEDWYKYSSVNMARLFDRPSEPSLGTIEFRHMGGTSNVNTILRWHSIVLQLFKASIAMPLPAVKDAVLGINNIARYRDLVYSVFTSDVAEYLDVTDFQSLLNGPIAKVKELFITSPKLEPTKAKSALAMYAIHLNKKSPKRKKAPPKKFHEGAAAEAFAGLAAHFDSAIPVTLPGSFFQAFAASADQAVPGDSIHPTNWNDIESSLPPPIPTIQIIDDFEE